MTPLLVIWKSKNTWWRQLKHQTCTAVLETQLRHPTNSVLESTVKWAHRVLDVMQQSVASTVNCPWT